jgi:hypothetical protein
MNANGVELLLFATRDAPEPFQAIRWRGIARFALRRVPSACCLQSLAMIRPSG